MATDIVQSLFGVTPQSYQRQQDALAEARALRFAELDPMQQATYGIYRGAGQLGGALGRALGGEDPELARITARQQIASQLDFNDPTSIQRAREALRQSNDAAGLLQLDAVIRQAQESGALVRQREAAARASEATAKRERGPTGDVAKAMRAGEITRALQTPDLTDLERSGLQAELDLLRPPKEKEPTTDALTNARAFAATKGAPGTPDYNAAFRDKFSELIAKAPAAAPSVGTDREAIAQAAPFNKPYAQLTPDEKAKVNALAEQKALSRAKAGAPTITQTQEKAEAGARGKMLVEDYGAISKQAGVAARSLPALESNLATLDKGFDTGFGTEVKATGARVLAALGVKDAEKYATDAQTFLANASAAVLQRQLEQKGPQTEADAQRITQTGAQLGNTKEANRFLLNVAKAQLKRDIAQRNFYAGWFKKNKSYDGAEDAWIEGDGGKSLFDSPELKKYAGGGAAAQIPTSAAPAAAAPTAPGMPSGFRRLP